eukprot:gene5440-6119_t
MEDEIPRIRQLDEVVVNRIAAGEVIQRPANAIKEMVENSLDAGSRSIQVTVKSGGLKLIQIQDDGCGISKDDLPIVCKRFTTSKLKKFDDLKSIQTFGFRGEALASISHVAHVAITTKTAHEKCAYKAKYQDGCLVGEPKACAGNIGTQIFVEDLFYNVSIRRNALKSASEEHAKITDVLSKYAIHNHGVSFILKKYGETIADVRTLAKSSMVDNIKGIYGPSIARELLEVGVSDDKLCFEMNGYISNANFSVKKCIFLLFINNRLVDSSNLRKSIEMVYANYLPKDKHPFIYMSIKILCSNIDVNIHPTKHEVHFLHEEAIIESIQRAVDSKLLGANESRHYYTQTFIPTLGQTTLADITDISSTSLEEQKSVNKNEKVYAHQMIRTDAREQKIEAFYQPNVSSTGNSCKSSSNDTPMEDGQSAKSNTSVFEAEGTKAEISVKRKRVESNEDANACQRRDINLKSVKNLRKAIDDNEHPMMKSLFEDHTFVGCVNRSSALIQHSTNLYLVNTTNLTKEMFYQIILFNFGNFGYIRLTNAAPIYELVMLALDTEESGWTQSDGPKHELANFAVDLLKNKAEMLMDYFSIEINENGELSALPQLLDKYIPDLNRLPMFILRLATDVDWDAEQECFHTLADVCSSFYSFGPNCMDIKQQDESGDDVMNTEGDANTEKEVSCEAKPWKWTVEHVLFPNFRHSLLPPKFLSENGTILQVACLPDLYKVFERC